VGSRVFIPPTEKADGSMVDSIPNVEGSFVWGVFYVSQAIGKMTLWGEVSISTAISSVVR
jgi:hypothetical protein